MGLKNKLNKMKSFLFDEEEDDYKKTSKKSSKVIKEEEEFSNTMEIEELYFEDEPKVVKPEEPVKTRMEKNEPEFKFPEFDDDDFVMVKKPEVLSPVIKEEVKPVLYQGSKRKEETKRFKPSPIISPIYGLLDNEGNTVKKDEKSKDYKSIKDEVSLEDVRKKAYGSGLDRNLENTLTRLSKKTLEEAEKDMEEEELRSEKKEVFNFEEDPIVTAKDEDESDDMLLPNVNFKEIDVDIEKGKKVSSVKEEIPLKKYDNEDDDDDDTKEQDLFNLIDSMYQKEGNDE